MGIASDETIEKVLDEIKKLPGKWLIRFAGGEPTLHPKLLYLCEEIVKTQHTVALVTNFHWSREKLLFLFFPIFLIWDIYISCYFE